jgi:hypothetical protein
MSSPAMDNYRIPRQRRPRNRVPADEQFARLLEVELVSTAATATDPVLGPLLKVAGALRAAGAVAGPPPLPVASKAAMRRRLVAVATVSAVEPEEAAAAARLRRRHAESVSRRVHRRLVAMAGSFALVTSVAGVGVAAAHSLPGDPFYGVKRATEAVQLWATQGDAAKGRLHLEFARTRLVEAEKLPADSSHLASTLAAMNSQTRQGSAELVSAYRSSGSETPIVTLVTFTQQQYADLATLAQHLPSTLHNSELAALNALTGVTTTIRSVTGQRCLLCLVGAVKPPAPKLTPGSRPPAPTTSPSPQPAKSATSGSTGPHRHPSPAPASSKTPGGLVPSNLVPSKLLPSNLLPSNLAPSTLLPTLLGTHHKSKSEPQISPLPVVSSLLDVLGL